MKISELKNKWNKDDLLKLYLMKKISNNLHLKIIDKYTNFDNFTNDGNISFLNSNLKQNDLFEDNSDLNEKFQEQLELCEKNDVQIISIFDEEYPKLLKEITHPPVILFVKGTLSENNSICISMVGTRRNTTYGKLAAQKFASVFANNNVIVVSGLAYGIDTISQMQVIKNNGITYSVIASGIDKLSPSESIKNSEKIIENGGAIISHYPCGTIAKPAYFLQRNRIIAGISVATIVVESNFKGGSLNTAKHAIQENRELYAVPGNILSEKSKGTNKLIKENKAIPALSPENILNELGITNDKDIFESKEKIKFSDDKEEKIYNVLNFEPIHIDDISEKIDMDISETLVKLLEMEFKGLIKQMQGKNYIRNL